MRDRIERIVATFGGRQFLSCYNDLCTALEVEIQYLLGRPQMKMICAETCHRAGKSRRAVSKSLSRAIEDLWYYGNSENIAQYCSGWKGNKPTPHEFIYEVARNIRVEERLYA